MHVYSGDWSNNDSATSSITIGQSQNKYFERLWSNVSSDTVYTKSGSANRAVADITASNGVGAGGGWIFYVYPTYKEIEMH